MRLLTVLTLAMLMAAAAPLATPAAAFHRDDLAMLYAETSSGAASWGVRFDVTETADLAVDLITTGPAAGSRLSAALAVVNEAGAASFQFTFTAVLSPDRTILVLPDTRSMPPGLVLTPRVGEALGGADAACTYFCLGIADPAKAPGTYRWVVWVGGGATNGVEVRAGSGASAAVARGNAWVAGDPEFQDAATNVQVQAGNVAPAYTGVGAKLIQEASVSASVQHRLYGVFYALDIKGVCLGVCVTKAQVDYSLAPFCAAFLHQGCSNGQISWQGPGGGQAGGLFYVFLGRAAGDYRFDIDLMADAYATRFLGFGVGVIPFEFWTILSVADAAVP